MPRRIQTDVHGSVSRLLKGDYLLQPPAWYGPVLKNPPQLPPLHSSMNNNSQRLDSGNKPFITTNRNTKRRQLPNWKQSLGYSGKPNKIIYPSDKIRRQFFEDFPFEAFRAKNLTEGWEVYESKYDKLIQSVDGWTTLKQLTINPSSEDCIQFCLNLHHNHHLSLSIAYLRATNQFSALKAELEVQKQASVDEAEAYGAQFNKSELERGYELEETFLNNRLQKSSNSGASSQEYNQPLIKLQGKDATKLIPDLSMNHRAAQRVGYDQGKAYESLNVDDVPLKQRQ